MDNNTRCAWLDGSQIYQDYNEWGRPVHDDNKLFEMLTLEAFQTGLMWITIFKKREIFRTTFEGFNLNIVVILNLLSIHYQTILSGYTVYLYYMFEYPIPLSPNIKLQLGN